LACAWQAVVLLRDDRCIRQLGGQVYRGGLGWTDTALLRRRRRW
jgi:hypothetical protein